ncbi:hypothetical protein [Bradyrhizobium sp. CB3481]|uniref:hypothetical protein n=1 Tax=Bradyrhizobium sp. CB3481 TaxID=3039158 RepID=UPI0024B23AC1|nr:hypothetical protein [Bradyrhizobium sp. CB3481]WFU14684.1 hypothetical protein QA643_26855 [Bradyrhizobium sp. CB3481]
MFPISSYRIPIFLLLGGTPCNQPMRGIALMQTEIDPAYLAQIQAARESICTAGQALEMQRKAFFRTGCYKL